MQRRKSKAHDKELTERNQLQRAWRQWHREDLERTLDGPHGSLMAGLMARLKHLTSPRDLLAFVEARNWSAVDYETRLVCLHEVNQTITRHRIRCGLAPFDDLQPRPNVFQRCRAILFPVTDGGQPEPMPAETTHHQSEDHQQ